MKGILPNVVRDNLAILLSNVSTQPNLKADKLGLKIPEDRVFFVYNSLFSVDLSALTPEDLEVHTLNY